MPATRWCCACPAPGWPRRSSAPTSSDAALGGQLDEIAQRLREAEVDTVVLGCTHYPLVADALQQRLGPAVRLIDTADAVARRVASLLPPAGDGPPGRCG